MIMPRKKTKRLLQWLTQAQFRMGKIPYLPSKNEGKIPHQVEIRNSPAENSPAEPPPPPPPPRVYSVSRKIWNYKLTQQDPRQPLKVSEQITQGWQKLLMRNSRRLLLFPGGSGAGWETVVPSVRPVQMPT